jgi:hypothetical protein
MHLKRTAFGLTESTRHARSPAIFSLALSLCCTHSSGRRTSTTCACRTACERVSRPLPVRDAAVRARLAARDPASPLLAMRVHICSANNFPTAAGLASSAAGYACLGMQRPNSVSHTVFSLAQLFGVADTELSSIARYYLACRAACEEHHIYIYMGMPSRAASARAAPAAVSTAASWPGSRACARMASTASPCRSAWIF